MDNPLTWLTQTDLIISGIGAPDDVITSTLITQKLPINIQLAIKVAQCKNYLELKNALTKYMDYLLWIKLVLKHCWFPNSL